MQESTCRHFQPDVHATLTDAAAAAAHRAERTEPNAPHVPLGAAKLCEKNKKEHNRGLV